MTDIGPSIGRIVHYVSYGTPGGEFTPECRAAIVTAVEPIEPPEARFISLCVLNPTGMQFREDCQQSEGDHRGGTWHLPEHECKPPEKHYSHDRGKSWTCPECELIWTCFAEGWVPIPGRVEIKPEVRALREAAKQARWNASHCEGHIFLINDYQRHWYATAGWLERRATAIERGVTPDRGYRPAQAS